MAQLVIFFWGWLFTSLLMGLAMGWIAVVHRGRRVSKRTSRWLAVVVAVLVTVALARAIPGRPGYWLDLGLLMFAPYLVGCAVGSWLRDWAISRPKAAA
jgi:predicted permease